MKFCYKTYKREQRIMTAVCDEDLCGKTIKFGDTSVHINPAFYKDKVGDEKELTEVLLKSFSANLVGLNTVRLGIKLGLVDRKKIKKLGNIPHAQIIIMDI